MQVFFESLSHFFGLSQKTLTEKANSAKIKRNGKGIIIKYKLYNLKKGGFCYEM